MNESCRGILEWRRYVGEDDRLERISTMNREDIELRLERAYAGAERSLKPTAEKSQAMHAGAIPRTYVGTAYGQAQFGGMRIPRIYVISMNQSRQGQELADDQVRQSLRNILRDEQGRFLSDGFGPRALAANLSRWVLMQCGVDKGAIRPDDVHDLIAYDNFVKWPFDVNRSEPDKSAWAACYDINKSVVETLRPELILCIGQPMYDHLWKALEAYPGYSWEKNVPGWSYSIIAPWGRAELGWCYHYSNPVWPNRIWRELQEEGKPPNNASTLLEYAGLAPAGVVEAARSIEEDRRKHPWWGQDTYVGESYTRYNPYQKFVAWHVCGSLVHKWL